MNRRRKGIRLERKFEQQLRQCFPSCCTEFKPQLTFLPKDFWGLFDGLTFFPKQRRYLFWQMKTNRLSQPERKHFWRQAKPFHTDITKVLLIEKHNNGFWVSLNQTKITLVENGGLKKFFTLLLRAQ